MESLFLTYCSGLKIITFLSFVLKFVTYLKLKRYIQFFVSLSLYLNDIELFEIIFLLREIRNNAVQINFNEIEAMFLQ